MQTTLHPSILSSDVAGSDHYAHGKALREAFNGASLDK
jgi:hypothetical protein